VLVSANNTPPSVTIASPTNGMLYPLATETVYQLSAVVSDTEQGPDQLSCAWTTVLHHNNHIHSDPPDTNCASSVTISPLGCDGQTYYYSIALTVTDSAGLSTTREVRLFPDCASDSPTLKYLGRDGTGRIRWQLMGDPTRTYSIEGSTNLVEWTSVTMVQPFAGLAEFNDPSEGFDFRFYRAVWVP
jgi:hypothetical protein